MGHSGSRDRRKSKKPPPSWWSVNGVEVPLEALANGDATLPNEIDESHRTIRQLAQLCLNLRQRLEEELNHRYGSRSEKRRGEKEGGGGDSGSTASDPNSSPASEGNSTGGASTDAGNPGSSKGCSGNKRPGHGRRPIPPHLPREEVEVPDEDVCCKRCHGPTRQLDRVVSYRYDYVPGYIRVRVLIRWRRVCDDPTCDAPFRIAKLPPEPIPKSRVTPGFLAHLLVTKFADHCPLYRFRKILLRQKVDLPVSTLVDYCKKATELLKPLWELLKEQVLSSAIIKTDDTHVRVRLPRKKGVLKGHLWAYKGDEAHRYVVCEFTSDWSGQHPKKFLGSYRGYIQADAYKGYDALFKEDTGKMEVGCWAHARRRWIKAEKISPRVAREALDMIRQLYKIEEDAKELMPEERKRVRQELSAPILEKLRIWMDDQKGRVLPKSAVGEAIEYAQNQWDALKRYLDDGRLQIDNTEIERELRSVALGRKNWMAAGSEVGGETAAIGYTMIASATASGIDAVEWLTDVLQQIRTCTPEQLVGLLPDRWKAARKAQSQTFSDKTVAQNPDTTIAPQDTSTSSPASSSVAAQAQKPPEEIPATKPTASPAETRPRPAQTGASPEASHPQFQSASSDRPSRQPPRCPRPEPRRRHVDGDQQPVTTKDTTLRPAPAPP